MWLVLTFTAGDTTATSNDPTPTAPTSVATTPSPTPTPTPTQEPTPSPTAPAVERTAAVSVLNNTGIQGLAASYSAKVKAKGWTVGGIGDWNGTIESNTVYYPAALKEQAELLAEDMGIDRLRASFAPMRTDRITIILSGPQQ